jgi:hypothetical protein
MGFWNIRAVLNCVQDDGENKALLVRRVQVNHRNEEASCKKTANFDFLMFGY